MIKFRNLLIVLFILVFVITVIVFSIIKFNGDAILTSLGIKTSSDTMLTSSSTTISNKKMGWGVKRNKDQKQPDLGSYKSVIDKYKGIAMGNPNNKYVYLTFDEGYEAGYTEKVLEVLKNNDVKATFFITGHYLNSATELVKRMITEGHIIGNHTSNHYSMPDIDNDKIKKDIMTLHTAVCEKTDYDMQFFRPPKGEFSERTLEATKNLGYTTVMWSVAYDDFDEKKSKGEEYAKQKILENVHPGAVILLHLTTKENANVLDYCIKEIKNMGYEFKNLDEFVR